jgi:hypothetical protein
MTELEICLLCGGAMTAFMFINFFVSSWVLCFAIILLALGTLSTMPAPVNPFLFAAVAVVAVGYTLQFAIRKFRDV